MSQYQPISANIANKVFDFFEKWGASDPGGSWPLAPGQGTYLAKRSGPTAKRIGSKTVLIPPLYEARKQFYYGYAYRVAFLSRSLSCCIASGQ